MKKSVVTFIIIIAGLLLGSFIGENLGGINILSWLNYGKTIGIQNLNINLYALNFDLSLTLKCTISTILGLIISIAVCLKVIK